MGKMTIDKKQGTTEDNRNFGYVSGNEGGFFFTWMDTLEETLDSIDEDEVDGDGGLDADDVREFLKEEIADDFPKLTLLAEIVSRSDADTDYTICYIDDKPCAVVEESDGGYYGILSDGEYVHNQYEQRYWYAKDGKWHHAFADNNVLIDIMEGYTERNINDGSQEVFDGALEEIK